MNKHAYAIALTAVSIIVVAPCPAAAETSAPGPSADAVSADRQDVATPAADMMTLRQCLELAVAGSGKVKVSELETDMREFERKSIRGHYLPLVRLDGKVIQFNDASNLKVDLSFLSTLTKDFEPLLSEDVRAQLAAYEKDGLKVKVRDDLVYEGGVTVAQPITQLFTVYSGERASAALVDAAKQDAVQARRKVETDVIRAYTGLVAARKMETTIGAALEQLDSMEKQVNGYMEAELVEKNALLKVQVAKTEYEKNLFAARKGARMAAAALNMMMARPLDTPLSPDPAGVSLDSLVEASAMPLEMQQNDAVRTRPELAGARAGSRAAKYGKWAAIGRMLPEINMIFRYHNTQGTGEMQPENEYFGGLVAQWDVWNWGVNYYAMKAADAMARKVEAQISEGEDMIRLDVQSRWLELEEARRSFEVTEKQVELATENLRIVKMRYDAGEATTTEYLEARTMETKAQNDLVIASVNVDAAIYALAVARGVDLLD